MHTAELDPNGFDNRIMKKTGGRKSRDTLPLTNVIFGSILK